MRRSLLACFLIALTSCGSAPRAIAPRATPYRLYTHCGVTHAQFAGAWWKAEPPLGDGQGNPPRGWGNPYEDGTIELRPNDTLLFRGGDGRTARFVRAPAGFTPEPCD